MSFATPHEAAAWITLAVGGGLADAGPTVWSAPGELGPLTVVLASSGLVGSAILDRLRGDESDEGSDDDGGLMDDDGLGGGLDGDMGGLDDDGDDLGDMDDWGGDDDDPFGEMDGGENDGGGDTDELEHRLDELEGEVASLSSTVGTVRSENEEIANQVEDVSENVRKLLDIYEMVTRGINPFVDEGAGAGDMAGGGTAVEGSFGLFDDDDDDGGGDESDENLDEDIANADASGFFDEDLAEEEPEADPVDGFDEDLEDGEADDETEPDGDDAFDADLGGLDDEPEDSEEMTTGDDGGDRSFAELKAEYESGDADWAGEDGTGEDPSAPPEADASEPVSLDGVAGADADDAIGELDETGGDDADPLAGLDDEADDDPLGGTAESEPDPEPATESEPAEASADHDDVDEDWTVSDEAESGFEFVEEPEDDTGRPFLRALPGAYVGDLVVMEWLEFLVEESDPTDAARAIRYYESVDWISEGVKEDLLDFLTGFGEVEEAEALVPGTDELTRSHHTRSLSYINRLDESDAESLVVDRWDEFSGGRDGV